MDIYTDIYTLIMKVLSLFLDLDNDIKLLIDWIVACLRENSKISFSVSLS